MTEDGRLVRSWCERLACACRRSSDIARSRVRRRRQRAKRVRDEAGAGADAARASRTPLQLYTSPSPSLTRISYDSRKYTSLKSLSFLSLFYERTRRKEKPFLQQRGDSNVPLSFPPGLDQIGAMFNRDVPLAPQWKRAASGEVRKGGAATLSACFLGGGAMSTLRSACSRPTPFSAIIDTFTGQAGRGCGLAP